MSDDGASSPPSPDLALDAALAAMRERYIETSRGTVRTFEQLSESLSVSPESADVVTALRRELHRVHGTAGSLGFHEAGRMAGALEGLLRSWDDDPTLDRERRSGIVLNFAQALREAISQVAGNAVLSGHRILLIGLPDALAGRLVAEATHRGFPVERVSAEEAAAVIAVAPPWGVVAMETAMPLTGPSGIARVLLRDASVAAGAPVVSKILVLDRATDPREIIDILDHLAEQGGTAGGTVLFVDDNPVVLALLRALAERAGLMVETAADGNGFLERLDRVAPSIVVLDIELPGADGIELLRQLRRSVEHRALPVLMLSGLHSGAIRAAAFEAGADDYMMKPIVPAEFVRRVTKMLELRRQRRVTTGLHPATGLPLPARTAQELEARLADRRGDADWSVGLVQAAAAPRTIEEIASWQRECARVAHAVRAAGGSAGLLDEPALALLLPVPPQEMVAMLTARFVEAPAATWSAGVVSTRVPGIATLHAMFDAASDACLAARESGVPARAWDPADADIAPDVIVVEDDTALTELLTYALSARGLSHRVYHNGPDGLAALLRLTVRDRRPIVLLDVDLPGLDGHSLHERLRVERPGAYRVVFISVHGSESDQLRALQGGALDYLTKPVSLRVLMAKLTAWRDRAGMM